MSFVSSDLITRKISSYSLDEFLRLPEHRNARHSSFVVIILNRSVIITGQFPISTKCYRSDTKISEELHFDKMKIIYVINKFSNIRTAMVK